MVFLVTVATLVAVTINVAVTLIRRLYPEVAIVAPPLHVVIHVYVIAAAELTSVLDKIQVNWIMLLTQGALAVRRVYRNIAVVTLLSKVGSFKMIRHRHYLPK